MGVTDTKVRVSIPTGTSLVKYCQFGVSLVNQFGVSPVNHSDKPIVFVLLCQDNIPCNKAPLTQFLEFFAKRAMVFINR